MPPVLNRRFSWTWILKSLILAVAFFYVGKSIYEGLDEIDPKQFTLKPYVLIISIFLELVYLCSQGWIWSLMLKRTISPEQNWQIWRGVGIFLISQVGKYVPGRVWVLAGRMYLSESLGIPKKTTFIVSLLADVLSLQAACLIAAIPLYLQPGLPDYLSIYLPILIVAGSFMCVIPNVFAAMLNVLLRLFKRMPIKIEFQIKDLFFFMLLFMLSWSVFGVAFGIFVSSIYPTLPKDLLWISASHMLAMVLGFVSLITPGGVGVREGVMTYLLGFSYPLAIGAMMAILARLWLTLGELLSMLIALWIHWRESRRDQ